jgi:hypothetical protein
LARNPVRLSPLFGVVAPRQLKLPPVAGAGIVQYLLPLRHAARRFAAAKSRQPLRRLDGRATIEVDNGDSLLERVGIFAGLLSEGGLRHLRLCDSLAYPIEITT